MKELAKNKKLRHDFKVLDKWEAGLKLTGSEVKAAKSGRADLTGSYITMKSTEHKNPELWLINANISRYPKSGYAQKGYDPLRNRKLLLNKKEISSLVGKLKQKGLTLMPLSLYTTSQRLVKLTVVLVKGKKKADKREDIKKRYFERRVKKK